MSSINKTNQFKMSAWAHSTTKIKSYTLKWFEEQPFSLTILSKKAKKYIKNNNYCEIYICKVSDKHGNLIFIYVGSSVGDCNQVGLRARAHDGQGNLIWTTIQCIQVIPFDGYDKDLCARLAEKWVTVYLKVVRGYYDKVKGSDWCKDDDLDISNFNTSNGLRYYACLIKNFKTPHLEVEIDDDFYIDIACILPKLSDFEHSPYCLRCSRAYDNDHPLDWLLCEEEEDRWGNRLIIRYSTEGKCI